MSADYRLYCHTCKVRTESLGSLMKEREPHETYMFAKHHIGHDLEFNDFSTRSTCKGSCYQPEYCEGDCYEVQLSNILRGGF